MWFKIKCIFPITTSIDGHESERDEKMFNIQLSNLNLEPYSTSYCYFNVQTNPIMAFSGGSLLLEGYEQAKDFTIIVFESGDTVNALGSPKEWYNKYIEFMESNVKK